MKSKTKTLPTDAVLRDMLKQAGLDSAGVQFRLLGDGMFNAVFTAETHPPCRIFCIVTRRATCAARPGW